MLYKCIKRVQSRAIRRAALPFAAAIALFLQSAITMGGSVGGDPEPVYHEALSPRDWRFPRDHGRHDGFRTEWWYFTGNVQDPAGRPFGFQLTIFRTAFVPSATTRPSGWAMRDLYFAHAAVSDIQSKSFVFADRLDRGRPGLAWASDQTMDVKIADWSIAMGDGGAIHLMGNDKNLKIDLACIGGKGPVLEGSGGVNAKGRERGQASYYYSMTRLATTGTLYVNGATFTVKGLSWMDHEFSSNALGDTQVGWDWMGLQLTDGTDLMIYRLRDTDASKDYLSGTHITADGEPHYLSASDLKLQGSEAWKSPVTGGVYPQKWTLWCKPIGDLIIASEFPGQELDTSGSSKISYFEGAAVVTGADGKPRGQGYLEMTGYAKALKD